MKKTSTLRSVLRAVVFVALLLASASAGWSLLNGGMGGGYLSDTASAQTPVTVVSAASFATDKVLAPDEIAAAFGAFVTQGNQVYSAQSVPLPTTLGGVSVKIGNTDAGLFFVSVGQINFQIPPGLADTANATITVTNSDNTTRTGTFTIVRASPGVFSAKATGQGVAAAQTTFDGTVFQSIANPDGTEKDVDAGTKTKPNALVLYATGIRNTPAQNPTDGNGVAEAVTVKFQGVAGSVFFAGPVQGLVGLDQINVIIPPELAGLGSVNIVVTVNGRTANTVTMKLGGQTPPVRVTDIAFGETKTSDLAVDDQVQKDNSTGNTYFFDAYRFTTTSANTTIAVDLRSSQFDAGVLLYRVDNNTLTYLAADDQSGGYGNGDIENNNSLLLTVLPDPATYVIFASSSDQEANGVGQYTLKLLNNVITPISYGQTTNGAAIAASDLQTSAGTYLDVYWFSGAQGDKQQIRLGSSAFDSFLVLQGNDGDPPLTYDDNSGGGTQGKDSLIDPTHGQPQPLTSLPRNGNYIVIVTPFEPNKTGAYSLSVNKLASFGFDNVEEFDFTAPGREIHDRRAPMAGFGERTFERFGRRRIVEQ
ncbi:MAG: hypothetical protein AB7U82_00955 [Blastocatellales bacterium]